MRLSGRRQQHIKANGRAGLGLGADVMLFTWLTPVTEAGSRVDQGDGRGKRRGVGRRTGWKTEQC